MPKTSIFTKRTSLLEKSTKKLYQKLFSMRKPKGLFLEKSYSVPTTNCRYFKHRESHDFYKLLKHRLKNKPNNRIYPSLFRLFKNLSTKPKFEILNLKIYKTPQKMKKMKNIQRLYSDGYKDNIV